MPRRLAGLVPVLLLTAWSCGPEIQDDLVRSAVDVARGVAAERLGRFDPIVEISVEMGGDDAPVKVALEEGHCYRVLAVRARDAEGPVSLGFKHSHSVVEKDSDFIELPSGETGPGNSRALWGFCVWPALVGDLTIYHDLAETGGHLMVLEAPASDLTWKDGRDVRLFMKAQGVDLLPLEAEEAVPRIEGILATAISEPLSGTFPDGPAEHKAIDGTEAGSLSYPIVVEPSTCYHLVVASLNCSTEYAVVGSKKGKTVHDDGAPEGVGRPGWSREFCTGKKTGPLDATIEIDLVMATLEYEHCWVGTALWARDASPKEIKKVRSAVAKASKPTKQALKKCSSSLKKCTKPCKKKPSPAACHAACEKQYLGCAEVITYPGQMGL